MGGSMIYLAGDTRWKAERDEQQCFLKNVYNMRIVAMETSSAVMSDKIKKQLCNEQFISTVEDEVAKLAPICVFIDTVQSRECTLGEGVHKWLQLDQKHNCVKWKNRNSMVCSTPAMMSYLLHPNLKGELLSNQQTAFVQADIFKRDSKLFDEYEKFMKGDGIYADENALELSPDMYWDVMTAVSSELSELALTYVSLPASTASLERAFSMWAFVHDKTRNRLSFDKSEKLLFCYHYLKTHKDSA